jgi:hypothetical protein
MGVDTICTLAEICVDAVLPRKRIWEQEDQYVPVAKRVKVLVLEPPPRRVIFSEQVMTFERSLDENDLKNAWYSPQDYFKFKIECASTVKVLKTVEGDTSKLNSSACCLRGLEELIVPKMQATKRKWKRDIVQIVLVQQKLQRKNGAPDPALIGALSERVSRSAVRTAMLLGKLDADRAAQLR